MADRQRGQEMLFGGEEAAGEPLPEVDQTLERNRLSYEKELLGCYVSGHPLAEYEAEVRQFSNQSLKPGKLAEVNGANLLRLAGVVGRMKQALTKKKEPYIRFQLEDLEGSIEVLVWPEVVKKHGQCLSNGAIIMVSGTLQRQDESRPTLIAREVMPLEDAQVRLTKAVHLHVKTIGLDDGLLQSVQRIAELSPGTASLYLHLATQHHGEVILESGPSLRIKPTRELVGQLRALLGEERVSLADRLLTHG